MRVAGNFTRLARIDRLTVSMGPSLSDIVPLAKSGTVPVHTAHGAKADKQRFFAAHDLVGRMTMLTRALLDKDGGLLC